MCWAPQRCAALLQPRRASSLSVCSASGSLIVSSNWATLSTARGSEVSSREGVWGAQAETAERHGMQTAPRHVRRQLPGLPSALEAAVGRGLGDRGPGRGARGSGTRSAAAPRRASRPSSRPTRLKSPPLPPRLARGSRASEPLRPRARAPPSPRRRGRSEGARCSRSRDAAAGVVGSEPERRGACNSTFPTPPARHPPAAPRPPPTHPTTPEENFSLSFHFKLASVHGCRKPSRA
ncbi:serine/arginine repetitive matrix protein 1-like [Heterocephalus glaber]|uniref:Serine/arginine repetitive matrix protein 1-like n=1 Tax=Heterocephalus glaber TaxID=10181 RepID=A0AAX6RNV6_HETGA|nr:serine/arginine repetitive matrix protein 1-like [Heterocephalus glaber]